MDLNDIIEAADMWQRLGWAVQGQVSDILAGDEDAEDANPNALKMGRDFVESMYAKGFISDEEREDVIALLTPPDEEK